jgi:hypothetical protein
MGNASVVGAVSTAGPAGSIDEIHCGEKIFPNVIYFELEEKQIASVVDGTQTSIDQDRLAAPAPMTRSIAGARLPVIDSVRRIRAHRTARSTALAAAGW